ncbi:MAG: AraC family transcriptional regulator ligand-binding domain-containing protein [Pseudomonadota bacterium]
MSRPRPTPILPTVSRLFVEDWLIALRRHRPATEVRRFLNEVGIEEIARPQARVTHDQIVRLYQIAAIETGDEMMGLWSRPIRAGALKQLCDYMRGASTMASALFRFASFWNLALDDYELTLERGEDALRVTLSPRAAAEAPQRFGHMLMLKLTHGVASWLSGREAPVRAVAFAFERPEFAADYPVLFPAPIRFGAARSSIEIGAAPDGVPMARTDAEMRAFLTRAPRDWIFTGYREHALALRVRELLLSRRLEGDLTEAAAAMNVAPRTLIRRLKAEGASFQSIKDGLRRDLAIRDLAHGGKSIEAIALDAGFASAANFHRAFKRWTGSTPGAYRARRPAVISGRKSPSSPP